MIISIPSSTIHHGYQFVRHRPTLDRVRLVFLAPGVSGVSMDSGASNVPSPPETYPSEPLAGDPAPRSESESASDRSASPR